MNAKIVNNDRNHARQMLHTVIPLDIPFNVRIEPSGNCNLKCNFCIHSLTKEEMILHNQRFGIMERHIFDLLISQLKQFPQKIKNICFAGMGEPLINKNLPYMVQQVRANDLADKILIITNGVLLNNDVSKALLKAGGEKLTIKISVNGLSGDDYYRGSQASTLILILSCTI